MLLNDLYALVKLENGIISVGQYGYVQLQRNYVNLTSKLEADVLSAGENIKKVQAVS